MWLLVVSCIAGPAAPDCSSGIIPIHYCSVQACADAAVVYHDQIRVIAEEAGLSVLLLDTRCLRLVEGDRA